MALSPLHCLLLLISLGLLVSTSAAASHQHNHSPATTTGGHHHHHHHLRHHSPTATTTHYHPSPTTTPSTHQNHNPTAATTAGELTQSLLVLDPVVAMVQAPPTGPEAVAAVEAAATHPSVVVPSEAAPPPPSVVVASPEIVFQAPVETHEAEAAMPATLATAAPLPDEPAEATTTLPLPHHHAAATGMSSPLPNHPAPDTGVGGWEAEQMLQQLARVLTSLGYNEMATAAPLIADSPVLAAWPGPITIFAAPDAALLTACPTCSRRHLLLEHIAPGFYPLASLAALPTVKLPSASMGFCLTLASTPLPFPTHHAKLSVDGVEISHPELYNDGRYVVHGLHGFVPPLSLTSCFHGSSHGDLLAARSANAAATSGVVVRIMMRDAIARLRDAGYGFVALAMRVKFAELERFGNMTVFALDDQAVFAGGGHGYVSDVRFHIVPGHRLTHADLLRLRAGTMLRTLAGVGHSLVVTHGAGAGTGSGVRINYVPINAPDAVLNSRVAVHGVYVPFPHLYLANLAASVAADSGTQVNDTCDLGASFSDCASAGAAATAAIIPAVHTAEGQ